MQSRNDLLQANCVFKGAAPCSGIQNWGPLPWEALIVTRFVRGILSSGIYSSPRMRVMKENDPGSLGMPVIAANMRLPATRSIWLRSPVIGLRMPSE